MDVMFLIFIFMIVFFFSMAVINDKLQKILDFLNKYSESYSKYISERDSAIYNILDDIKRSNNNDV